MRSTAFLKAEQARRQGHSVPRAQRVELQRLARKAGIETPRVYSLAEVSDAITRLEAMVRQPHLEGFRL